MSNRYPKVEEAPSGDIEQLLKGFLITIVSVGILLGSFLLSQLDAAHQLTRPTPIAAVSPTFTPFLPTLSPTAIASEVVPSTTPTSASSPTAPSPLMPSCTRPAGWVVHTVQRGETLVRLAWRCGVSVLTLRQANCLSTPSIWPGQELYLPPTFHASPTPRPYRCGPPLDWVLYTVQPGDTLYSLSRRVNVSIEALRRGNCLSGYTIYTGQKLYLPLLPPTRLPSPTPIPASPTPSPSPTATSRPSPIDTPTSPPTIAPSPTLTPTVITPTPPHLHPASFHLTSSLFPSE
jgi:LysM repeat protein